MTKKNKNRNSLCRKVGHNTGNKVNLAHKKSKLVKRIKKLSHRYGGGHNYVSAARERLEKLQK